MPLDPLQMRLRALRISLIDQSSDCHYQILIHDRFALRREPVILLPINVPDRRAVDRVVAISQDADVVVAGDDLEGALDGGQFCTLIGLGFAF